ncbi:MAG: hypothetical protein KDN18_24530 [Verrucomicrobiae bacterium]|nr:hypothetical protein [Verrucomicrobiae bacterium]
MKPELLFPSSQGIPRPGVPIKSNFFPSRRKPSPHIAEKPHSCATPRLCAGSRLVNETLHRNNIELPAAPRGPRDRDRPMIFYVSREKVLRGEINLNAWDLFEHAAMPPSLV